MFVRGLASDVPGDADAAPVVTHMGARADHDEVLAQQQQLTVPSAAGREQMRAVLGPDPPDETLNMLLVAANNNIERAIHYFFAQ